MAVNKVVYNTDTGEQVLIDLTGDTVTADTLLVGATAHDKSGNIITGTATVGETINLDAEFITQSGIITDQDSLIAAIIAALEGKAAGGGYVEETFLGDKLYTFAVFADIHLTETNYQNGVSDFTRAMPFVEAKGAEFACIAGDVGRESTDPELVIYRDLIATANIPYYACRGNHDAPYTEDHWQACTGHPSNFSFVKNGDVFLFVSPDIYPNYSISGTVPYTGALPWLKEQLEIYKGARIFLFIHFPPSGYSGLMSGQYYGFTSASTQDDEIVTAVNKAENVVMFHGHTHFNFAIEEEFDNVNVYQFNASKTAFVHVPSCSHCRDSSMTAMTELSQAYIVEVYEQGVVLRGIDLTTGEYMPDYEYLLSIDNHPEAVKNAIMISDADVKLKPGESTTIEVYMSTGAGTVSVTPSNNAITVSPSTLIFTDDNYSTRQSITITVANDIGEIVAALVTLSSDGLTNKVISVTLSDSALDYTELTSGQHIVADGEAYTGTYSGAQLEFLDGEYDITFDNLTITGGSETILHSNDIDVQLTCHFIGDNTFTSASNRAMSCEFDYPINFIGEGTGASVLLKSTSSKAVIKGPLRMENIDVEISSTKMPLEGMGDGFVLVRNGSFEVNKAKVVLLPSEHGYASIEFGTAPTPGSSDVDIDDTPDSGYNLVDILVDGVSVGADGDHITMPAANATVTVQAVFGTGAPVVPEEPDAPAAEVITIPWVENLKIQSNTGVETTDTTVMSTQEYFAIEDGYSYTVSTTTLGTLGFRAMFYDGAAYQDFLSTSIDIGEDVFPTQYSYTLVIPSGATHFRLRAKTDGAHQTWKDRIVLTKTKIV